MLKETPDGNPETATKPLRLTDWLYLFVSEKHTIWHTRVFKDNRNREALIPINAGCIYNLNDVIQLHECTQSIKKEKKKKKTTSIQANKSACADKISYW